MTLSAKELYKDYWVGAEEERGKRLYYQRLYQKIRPKILVDSHWKVLDVAGGNGQFMQYLGIRNADILDISQSGLEVAGRGSFGHGSPLEFALLVGSGLVTALPLVGFGVAVRDLPLSVVGFFQYLSPSLQFALAIWVYREPWTSTQARRYASCG